MVLDFIYCYMAYVSLFLRLLYSKVMWFYVLTRLVYLFWYLFLPIYSHFWLVIYEKLNAYIFCNSNNTHAYKIVAI